METKKIKKVKLKGNESFNFREGWLRKGVRCVCDYPNIFSMDDVMERLGVGSKMVKSIKYWIQATGLCEEKIEKNKHNFYLTKDFGEIVNTYDKYFDDIATLYFVHYNIVSNAGLCIVWNIFFNEYHGRDFTKEDMASACKEFLERKMEEGASFSENLFNDDCSSILRMYLPMESVEDPEDSLACPLHELGLLQKSTEKKNAYIKSAPSKYDLDMMVVLYVILKNMSEEKKSVSIDDLLTAPNNIGRVFNLDRIKINEYLDQLRAARYITINRTAGLDMVYCRKDLSTTDIMEKYYRNVQEI